MGFPLFDRAWGACVSNLRTQFIVAKRMVDAPSNLGTNPPRGFVPACTRLWQGSGERAKQPVTRGRNLAGVAIWPAAPPYVWDAVFSTGGAPPATD